MYYVLRGVWKFCLEGEIRSWPSRKEGMYRFFPVFIFSFCYFFFLLLFSVNSPFLARGGKGRESNNFRYHFVFIFVLGFPKFSFTYTRVCVCLFLIWENFLSAPFPCHTAANWTISKEGGRIEEANVWDRKHFVFGGKLCDREKKCFSNHNLII